MCIVLHIAAGSRGLGDLLNALVSMFKKNPAYWLVGCNSIDAPAGSGLRLGVILTTLFENHAASIVSASSVPATPKKHGWLPLLTVLFLISYGLMTMLIIEQGETIQSQRALIRDLFRDNRELSASKTKTLNERAVAPSAKTQTPSTQKQSSQAPVGRSGQAPTIQAPSSQAGPQHSTKSEASKQKHHFPLPPKPAADLVDDARTLITI